MKDLTGQIFGRLTAIKPIAQDKKKNYIWLCECSCSPGQEYTVAGDTLVQGKAKSCGCYRLERSVFGLWRQICEKVDASNRKVARQLALQIKNNNLTRLCPQCNQPQTYSCYSSFNTAVVNNSICVECRHGLRRIEGPFERECPKCNKVITYQEHYRMINAEQAGSLCNSCRLDNPLRIQKITDAWKTPETRKRASDSQRLRRGTTLISGQIPSTGLLQTWGKKVRDRDKYCLVCYSADNLRAHHLKPKALFPDLALDLENGITLCENCHRDVHNYLLPFPLCPSGEENFGRS